MIDSITAGDHAHYPARRVISLSASGFDALLELGLAPIGGIQSEVVAQPDFYGERPQPWVDVGSWLLPNYRAIQQAHPDLVLGWQFPHRFYRRRLAKISPVYLMRGSGHTEAVLRLLDIACLTGRMSWAEEAIASLNQQLTFYQRQLQSQPRQTVLMMGGASLNRVVNRYPIETDTGTLGSVMKRFTHFPWSKPDPHRGEPGLTYLSLHAILAVDPDIIFVQSYAPTAIPLSQQLANHAVWQRLKAVKTQQVYEVEQFWHWGNGTWLIRVMLKRLLPLIYPQCFTESIAQKGLRQRELCDRLGLNYKKVATAAKQLGLSTHTYLQQRTGWQLRNEYYYPPNQGAT